MKMADLKAALAELGFQEIQSYIQSGNIVFQNKKSKESELETQISEKIEATFGYVDVPVKVLSAKDLQSLFKKNPFVSEEQDIKQLHATLLSSKPSKTQIALIKEMDFGNDQFIVDGKTVYLNIENPYHKTKLGNGFFEKKFDCRATTRNWKTTTKLVEMCEPDF